MITEIKMPVLALTMEEGTSIDWTKVEGDKIATDGRSEEAIWRTTVPGKRVGGPATSPVRLGGGLWPARSQLTDNERRTIWHKP